MHVQLDGTGGRLEDGAAEEDDGRYDDGCGADDGGRDEEEDTREDDVVPVLDGGAQEEAATALVAAVLLVVPPEDGLNPDWPGAPLDSTGSWEDDVVVGLVLLTSRRRQLHEPQVPSPPHTCTPAPPWGQAQFCVSPALQSCGPQPNVLHTAQRMVPPNNKTRRTRHLLTPGV